MKKNWIIIGLTSVLGIAAGWYLNTQSSEIHTSRILVKPNFKSTSQLISNINYYNSLVDEENYNQLAEELEIDSEQALAIKSLKIEPEFNETELLEEYDKLARRSDTMALENFTFQGFMAAKRDIDYEFHNIQISATDSQVLDEILDNVVKVQENSMIKAERLALKENADFDLKMQQQQLVELDSLIVAYQTAIKSNSSGNAATNLYLGDQRPSQALKDLFEKKRSLLYEISETRKDKYSYDQTVHIVSQFVKRGYIEKKHWRLKGALVGFGLGLLIALIPVLLRFLNSYEKKHA